MWEWIAGFAAFGLYVLYDWNRVYGKNGWMRPFFALGTLILAGLGIWFIMDTWTGGERLWLIPAAVSLTGLIHTLFFALPFDDTYRREADGQKVCRTGAYGVCRHPGIWWFFGCFACLGMAGGGGERLRLCLCLSALNLGYAWYQDRLIFVKEFSDYEEYRSAVPFLIPKIRRGGGKAHDL